MNKKFENKKEEFIYYVEKAKKFKDIDAEEFNSCMSKARDVKRQIDMDGEFATRENLSTKNVVEIKKPGKK